MKNVEMSIEGNILTIKVDLSKDFGPSASGKTIIIASSEGNQSIPGKEVVKIGLNVYKEIKPHITKDETRFVVTESRYLLIRTLP